MSPTTLMRTLRGSVLSFVLASLAPAQGPLPGSELLTTGGDVSAEMVSGIGRFLDRETEASVAGRESFWHVDFSSREAYDKSTEANRARLTRMIGAVDPRVMEPAMELIATVDRPAKRGESDRFTAYAVRWPVMAGVHGEGLWLQPKGTVIARVVVVPDADQTPEMVAGLMPGVSPEVQFARRLADAGCEVIVPTLVDRSDRYSGNGRVDRFTNQPNREWIYRQAYEMGRHIIGYEVQKVRSAVDWFTRQANATQLPVGVLGWGEGGLIAFYAGAIDTRIGATALSGYFGKRDGLWAEPIYRNVFGLLREFDDAHIARLVLPRTLIIDAAPGPEIAGPPEPHARHAGAAPGRLVSPTAAEVSAEIARARNFSGSFAPSIQRSLPNGLIDNFLTALAGRAVAPSGSGGALTVAAVTTDHAERQRRQVEELERFTRRLLALSQGVREDFVWKKLKASTPDAWRVETTQLRQTFWNDVIGRFPTGQVPPRPRTRPLLDQPQWSGYEVVLDVMPDVFAWGYLLLPKGMKPGEKRPVVVVQHGLEGLPGDVIDTDPKSRAFAPYKAFGARLAERGFIVFAPHNPYRGGDVFRLLQRKANPLGKSLFSIITAQHEVILDWLATQPNVDPQRIGFYGLSYGGKTAMRVPALVERYALSICSGDFNEWIWKNVTTDWRGSYLFTKEWEMPEFNLGSTFGYAEMAALIAPRPFMVERGHDDGVGLDEWVAFEYAKVNRLYARLGISDRTAIEFFVGPHTIHGAGTFQFLHRHLQWPAPQP